MARGWERPPLWAVIAMVVGAAVMVGGLLVGVPAGEPLSRAEITRMDAAATAAQEAGAAASPTITIPADPRLLILGDSYTQGYAAEPREQGYAYLVGNALGWEFQVDGVGGTGFTYDGPNGRPESYDDRIAALAEGPFDPNVVVLQGGQNDYRVPGVELTAAVAAEVQQLQAVFPGVQVVIFGPAAPQPLGGQLVPQDEAIRAGAAQVGAPYISPVQGGWLTVENSDEYAHEDGSHLNTAGHAYLADRFLAAFAGLTGS